MTQFFHHGFVPLRNSVRIICVGLLGASYNNLLSFGCFDNDNRRFDISRLRPWNLRADKNGPGGANTEAAVDGEMRSAIGLNSSPVLPACPAPSFAAGLFCWTPESWRHLYVCRTGLSHLSWNPLVGSPHQGVPEDATLEAEGSLVFSLSTVPVMHPPLAVRNVAI